MHFNRRMNGLEYSFEGAPAISLRVLDRQFLQVAVQAPVLSAQSVKTPSAGGR